MDEPTILTISLPESSLQASQETLQETLQDTPMDVEIDNQEQVEVKTTDEYRNNIQKNLKRIYFEYLDAATSKRKLDSEEGEEKEVVEKEKEVDVKVTVSAAIKEKTLNMYKSRKADMEKGLKYLLGDDIHTFCNSNCDPIRTFAGIGLMRKVYDLNFLFKARFNPIEFIRSLNAVCHVTFWDVINMTKSVSKNGKNEICPFLDDTQKAELGQVMFAFRGVETASPFLFEFTAKDAQSSDTTSNPEKFHSMAVDYTIKSSGMSIIAKYKKAIDKMDTDILVPISVFIGQLKDLVGSSSSEGGKDDSVFGLFVSALESHAGTTISTDIHEIREILKFDNVSRLRYPDPQSTVDIYKELETKIDEMKSNSEKKQKEGIMTPDDAQNILGAIEQISRELATLKKNSISAQNESVHQGVAKLTQGYLGPIDEMVVQICREIYDFDQGRIPENNSVVVEHATVISNQINKIIETFKAFLVAANYSENKEDDGMFSGVFKNQISLIQYLLDKRVKDLGSVKQEKTSGYFKFASSKLNKETTGFLFDYPSIREKSNKLSDSAKSLVASLNAKIDKSEQTASTECLERFSERVEEFENLISGCDSDIHNLRFHEEHRTDIKDVFVYTGFNSSSKTEDLPFKSGLLTMLTENEQYCRDFLEMLQHNLFSMKSNLDKLLAPKYDDKLVTSLQNKIRAFINKHLDPLLSACKPALNELKSICSGFRIVLDPEPDMMIHECIKDFFNDYSNSLLYPTLPKAYDDMRNIAGKWTVVSESDDDSYEAGEIQEEFTTSTDHSLEKLQAFVDSAARNVSVKMKDLKSKIDELKVALKQTDDEIIKCKSSYKGYGEMIRSAVSNKNTRALRADLSKSDGIYGVLKGYLNIISGGSFLDKLKNQLKNLSVKFQDVIDQMLVVCSKSTNAGSIFDGSERDAKSSEIATQLVKLFEKNTDYFLERFASMHDIFVTLLGFHAHPDYDHDTEKNFAVIKMLELKDQAETELSLPFTENGKHEKLSGFIGDILDTKRHSALKDIVTEIAESKTGIEYLTTITTLYINNSKMVVNKNDMENHPDKRQKEEYAKLNDAMILVDKLKDYSHVLSAALASRTFTSRRPIGLNKNPHLFDYDGDEFIRKHQRLLSDFFFKITRDVSWDASMSLAYIFSVDAIKGFPPIYWLKFLPNKHLHGEYDKKGELIRHYGGFFNDLYSALPAKDTDAEAAEALIAKLLANDERINSIFFSQDNTVDDDFLIVYRAYIALLKVMHQNRIITDSSSILETYTPGYRTHGSTYNGNNPEAESRLIDEYFKDPTRAGNVPSLVLAQLWHRFYLKDTGVLCDVDYTKEEGDYIQNDKPFEESFIRPEFKDLLDEDTMIFKAYGKLSQFSWFDRTLNRCTKQKNIAKFELLNKANTNKFSSAVQSVTFLFCGITAARLNILMNTKELSKCAGDIIISKYDNFVPMSLYAQEKKNVENNNKDLKEELVNSILRATGYVEEYRRIFGSFDVMLPYLKQMPRFLDATAKEMSVTVEKDMGNFANTAKKYLSEMQIEFLFNVVKLMTSSPAEIYSDSKLQGNCVILDSKSENYNNVLGVISEIMKGYRNTRHSARQVFFSLASNLFPSAGYLRKRGDDDPKRKKVLISHVMLILTQIGLVQKYFPETLSMLMGPEPFLVSSEGSGSAEDLILWKKSVELRGRVRKELETFLTPPNILPTPTETPTPTTTSTTTPIVIIDPKENDVVTQIAKSLQEIRSVMMTPGDPFRKDITAFVEKGLKSYLRSHFTSYEIEYGNKKQKSLKPFTLSKLLAFYVSKSLVIKKGVVNTKHEFENVVEDVVSLAKTCSSVFSEIYYEYFDYAQDHEKNGVGFWIPDKTNRSEFNDCLDNLKALFAMMFDKKKTPESMEEETTRRRKKKARDEESESSGEEEDGEEAYEEVNDEEDDEMEDNQNNSSSDDDSYHEDDENDDFDLDINLYQVSNNEKNNERGNEKEKEDPRIHQSLMNHNHCLNILSVEELEHLRQCLEQVNSSIGDNSLTQAPKVQKTNGDSKTSAGKTEGIEGDEDADMTSSEAEGRGRERPEEEIPKYYISRENTTKFRYFKDALDCSGKIISVYLTIRKTMGRYLYQHDSKRLFEERARKTKIVFHDEPKELHEPLSLNKDLVSLISKLKKKEDKWTAKREKDDLLKANGNEDDFIISDNESENESEDEAEIMDNSNATDKEEAQGIPDHLKKPSFMKPMPPGIPKISKVPEDTLFTRHLKTNLRRNNQLKNVRRSGRNHQGTFVDEDEQYAYWEREFEQDRRDYENSLPKTEEEIAAHAAKKLANKQESEERKLLKKSSDQPSSSKAKAKAPPLPPPSGASDTISGADLGDDDDDSDYDDYNDKAEDDSEDDSEDESGSESEDSDQDPVNESLFDDDE